MRTYRGIVCDKKTKYMVFLTEKGEFLRGVPIGKSPEVGEESEFRLIAPSFISKGKVKQRFVGAVFVAAALLFFVMSSLSPLNEKVMAYVQLDAGTAMEFGVDQKGNVISLRFFNGAPSDPDRLIALKGHPILSVLDLAVMELAAQGKQIIVTTIPTQESKRETNEKIGNAVQEVRSKHRELNLEIVKSTPEARTVANKKKMSIHQFKAIQIEESINEKKPVNNSDRIKERSVPEQNEASQKPKKETVPPETQQNGEEKEQTNKSEEQQSPPTEKFEKKSNNSRSENGQPNADKKGPPSSPPGLNKQSDRNQGNPSKSEKGKPEKETGKVKPFNEKKAGSGPPF